MTPRQHIAHRFPCARAFDTLDPKFCELVEYRGTRWSTILTLNK